MERFKCHYDKIKFIYFKHLLDKNGFVYYGNNNTPTNKIAAFIGDRFNVYVDCHDGGTGENNPKVICHACGKPFLYFKTAYSPLDYESAIEGFDGCGVVEPFFKWCGANSTDGFFNQLYPFRKQFIEKNKNTIKNYDIGFCCALEGHAVSEIRKDYYHKFKCIFGDKFYHREKLKYPEYINQSLQWKTSFNCRGCGEYTSRIIDACSIGKPSILSSIYFDNAISWKGYIPQINFEDNEWVKSISDVIDNYDEWGQKCLYYFEHYWTPDAIFQYMITRINKFESELK